MDQYFVTARDNGKTALLLGPFTNELACMHYAKFAEDGGIVHEIIQAIERFDRAAHWYSYGMVKIKDVKPDEKYTGVLNRMYPEVWDKVLV